MFALFSFLLILKFASRDNPKFIVRIFSLSLCLSLSLSLSLSLGNSKNFTPTFIPSLFPFYIPSLLTSFYFIFFLYSLSYFFLFFTFPILRFLFFSLKMLLRIEVWSFRLKNWKRERKRKKRGGLLRAAHYNPPPSPPLLSFLFFFFIRSTLPLSLLLSHPAHAHNTQDFSFFLFFLKTEGKVCCRNEWGVALFFFFFFVCVVFSFSLFLLLVNTMIVHLKYCLACSFYCDIHFRCLSFLLSPSPFPIPYHLCRFPSLFFCLLLFGILYLLLFCV